MSVEKNYQNILQTVEIGTQSCHRLSKEVTVIAVTKGRPVSDIHSAYQAGCRHFGESRVQEFLRKKLVMPADIEWHFIGTLQQNKVSKVVGQCSLIHSVDSVKLAQKISSCSIEQKVITPVLLQVNTSHESTKHGLSNCEWKNVFESVYHLPGIHVKGLMTIAPLRARKEITSQAEVISLRALSEGEQSIRESFVQLRQFQNELIQKFGYPLPELSMGMTQDYLIAIAEGATLLRIGRGIFKN